MSLARNLKNFVNCLKTLWVRTCGEIFQWLLKAKFELNYATVKNKWLYKKYKEFKISIKMLLYFLSKQWL